MMDQDFEKLDAFFAFRRSAIVMAVVGGLIGTFFSLFFFGILMEYIFMVVHSLSEPAEFIGFGFMFLGITPYALLGPLGAVISCRTQLKRQSEIVDKAEPGRWGLFRGLIAGIVAGFLPVIPVLIIVFYQG